MPLFTRRRIQAMLDELGPVMERGKAKDMLARLGRTRQPDQVLAAEMELGLLWAMRQVGHVEVEPKAADGRRPDSASNDLLGNVPAIIEITTVSDAHFSGEKLMRRAFFKIVDFANTVCRDAKYELSMLFGEETSNLTMRCGSSFGLGYEVRKAKRCVSSVQTSTLQFHGRPVVRSGPQNIGRRCRPWPTTSGLIRFIAR